jgi:hypothetical protein
MLAARTGVVILLATMACACLEPPMAPELDAATVPDVVADLVHVDAAAHEDTTTDASLDHGTLEDPDGAR